MVTQVKDMVQEGAYIKSIPEWSPPVLDLCIKRNRKTPSPERNKCSVIRRNSTCIEKPSSTVGIASPASLAESETSEISTSSDGLLGDVSSRFDHTTVTAKVKIPRPFKAYPKNPLYLAAPECILNKESAEAYTEFRQRMLSQVQANNGTTNKNMRRISQCNNSHNREDSTYWEKRRKNNEAAKRSRDARRAKEDELAIRAAFLERENLHLRCEISNMKLELEELRTIVYRRPLLKYD